MRQPNDVWNEFWRDQRGSQFSGPLLLGTFVVLAGLVGGWLVLGG